MEEINLGKMDYLKLKLKKDRKKLKYTYKRNVLNKICILNGMDPSIMHKINICEGLMIAAIYFKYLEGGGKTDSVGDEITETVNNVVGFYNIPKYKPIVYLEPENPHKNWENFLKLHTLGHDYMQKLNEEDYKFFGVILSIILLLEHKLDYLLIKFDKKIKDKTLGSKIKVYRDFLIYFDPAEGENIEEYEKIIPPFNELNKFRNSFVHKFKKSFALNDISLIKNFMENESPHITNLMKNVDDESIVGQEIKTTKEG